MLLRCRRPGRAPMSSLCGGHLLPVTLRLLLTAVVPPTAPPAVKIESWDNEAGMTREKEGSGDAVKGDAAMQARERRLRRGRGRCAARRAREMRRRHGGGRCCGKEAESDTGEGDRESEREGLRAMRSRVKMENAYIS